MRARALAVHACPRARGRPRRLLLSDYSEAAPQTTCTLECTRTPAQCMCKRGFGSPRIWIPHPKTLADLDDPSACVSADLDPPRIWIPPFTLCTIASRMMTSNVGSQTRTPKRGFGSPADLDPDSQRIVEDLFRQVSMSLAHSD